MGLLIVILVFLFVSSESANVDYEKRCKERICIGKCCNDNEYVYVTEDYIATCVERRDSVESFFKNFTDLLLYDNQMRKTVTNARDTFYFVPLDVVNNNNFNDSMDLTAFGYYNYLTKNGVVILGMINAYGIQYLNTSNFCVDYLTYGEGEVLEPKILVYLPSPKDPETNIYFITSALVISCVFLALVLAVYSLLPELRNLGGLILMAYVASLLGGFLLLAKLQILTLIELNYPAVCLTYTYFIYFFLLASFCWMNVMSFDIWWTFRGYAKARPIHRYGERFKFLVYCIYAFGVPFVMTIGLIVLNHIDLSAYPFFIQPNIISNGCFLEGGEKLLYLYTPMMILVISNWIFFLMTAFNLWRLNRATAVLDTAAAGTPAAHRTQRHRLMVYLKLSVIMGISWVLEVVSFTTPGLKIWYLSDAYNILIGVSIFLIFVFKKKIIRKLEKKIMPGYKTTRNLRSSKSSQSSTTTDSDASQEVSLQVCQNPNGYAQYTRQSSFAKADKGML